MKQILVEGYSQTWAFEGGAEQERCLAILPFFHVYGYHLIMSGAIFQGAFVSCLPKFEPETYIKALIEHKVNIYDTKLLKHGAMPLKIKFEINELRFFASQLYYTLLLHL